MALRFYKVKVNGSPSFEGEGTDLTTTEIATADTAVDDIDTAIDAVESGELATLTAAIVDAQAIGAGDASTEIDAIDTSAVALVADIAALQTVDTTAAIAAIALILTSVGTSDIRVILNNVTVDSLQKAVHGLERVIEQLNRSDEFTLAIGEI